MLISKPTVIVKEQELSELQKMALKFLPREQVTKFHDFQDLIELELLNEAREPEIENTLKDLFNALHERNTPKLLKVLQGDKKKLFFAFKKQLENKASLTKSEAKVLAIINEKEISLLTISLMKG
nr:MAG TPA: hypothetical protein [Caudoviricetes sp.]